MDVDARIEALEAVIARKDEEIARLETALGLDFLPPPEWRLTPAEARVFGCLLERELMTKDAAMAALYRDLGKDEPDQKIVDVYVCKIRNKVTPFGVSIETRWGVGYFLSAAVKAAVRERLAEAA